MSIKKLALLLAVFAAACVGVATAHAQNNRTFVSNAGVAGNTSLGCSAASPCDTFVNALSVTNSGGEINCLDAGDFKPVTITQAVTINCEGASNGGITASRIAAITVNTSSPVNLIGLDINGLNAAGGNGVYIESNGVVNIRNCKIHGFLGGGGLTGTAIVFAPASSGGNLVVDNVLLANNFEGIWQYTLAGASNMTVGNSNINNISGGAGILLTVNGGSGGTHAGATIEQSTLAFNGYGLSVDNPGAVALIGGSTVVNNTGYGVATDGGTVYSFKNNQIGGNATDGTPLTAYPGGPLN